MDWYVFAMRRYVGFAGRASRREYFWAAAMMLLISVLVGLIMGIGGDRLAQRAGALVAALHLLPQLAVGARRLHDAGLSGWWQLVGLIPAVGPLILLGLMLVPSRAGGDRYGPRPRPSHGPDESSA